MVLIYFKQTQTISPIYTNTNDEFAHAWSMHVHVNIEENAIGEPYLTTFWQDPDFDQRQKSFYYVRVIEIPTPIWIAYDAKAYGIKLPDGADPVNQERAYTSPIWYTP